MESEVLDVSEVAGLLQRDEREVSKMATRGHLPGQRIQGEWRFATVEIQHWVEKSMPGYTAEELTAIEVGVGQGKHDGQLLVSPMLTDATVAVPLVAGTRSSLMKALIGLAEQSWQLYDTDAALEAIRKREEIGSTAVEGGIAFVHPNRVLPSTVLGDSVLAFGRTARGIPFGAPDGMLTDLFFVVLCTERRLHLSLLARLSRLMRLPNFADYLRTATTPAEARMMIEDAERTIA